jgi:hypothetical protein
MTPVVRVESKGVPDGEDLLAHFEIARGADRNGGQGTTLGVNLQDRQVLVGLDPDQPGRPRRMVRQRNVGGLGALDDVEIRHDVAVGVPDEPGPAPLRHFRGAEAERTPLRGLAGDEDHRWRRPPKQLDGALLVFRKVPSRRDGARHGVLVVQAEKPRPNLPEQQHDEQSQQKQNQPTLVIRFRDAARSTHVVLFHDSRLPSGVHDRPQRSLRATPIIIGLARTTVKALSQTVVEEPIDGTDGAGTGRSDLLARRPAGR